MSALVQRRCVVHASREAAARCPSCRQFYCRECVTEHDGRILCATCLRRQTAPETARRRSFAFIRVPIQVGAGFIVAWLAFYLLGQALLQSPSEWHEGKTAEKLLMGGAGP